MANYRVTLDIGRLPARVQAALQEQLADVSAAVKLTGAQVQGMWQAAVRRSSGVPMYLKDEYVKSITLSDPGPFTAIIESNHPRAGEIENGFPVRDLKRMLQTSNKTRQAQSGPNAGKKYLIIPLRHNTPGNTAHAKDMPASVYAAASALTASKVVSTGMRTSATGHKVVQQKYNWGGRLPAGMTPKLKPHHATDIHAGMVKMKESTGGNSYMTFRVMGEWQSGKWIIPAKPGIEAMANAAKFAEQQLHGNVQSAILKKIGV